MSGESVGLPSLKYETVPGTGGALAVQNDKALILREQLEFYVEAAIVLRDLVRMGPVLPTLSLEEYKDLYALAARREQYGELIRQATAILEQLGLVDRT